VSGKALRAGSAILTVAAAGILGASLAILTPRPNPWSSAGRHLWAGALANACLALLLIAIAAIPLRRGEKWAFWAYLVPIALYGLPMAILDTIFVPRATLLRTLAPQVAGLAAVAVGLALCAMELWKD
jgi:uncharacterized membrane protein